MAGSNDDIRSIFSQTPPEAEPAPTAAEAQKPRPSGRVRLDEISPMAWEHPADSAALAALRRLSGFDAFLRKFLGAIGERRLRYLYLASAVRVNERQFKDVHAIFIECCTVLDIKPIPELYISQSPLVNAGAVGLDEPFIVLNSATLDLCDERELAYVIGHELGHIASQHVLYKTILYLLLNIGLGRIGLPGLALFAIVAALKEWDRKSELSSDRAGLLCAQDADACYRALMKLAGGPKTEQMDTAEFIRQAEEYERGGDLRDGALKLLNLLWLSHPFPVLRLAELRRFVDDGAYLRILNGDYVRRGTERERTLREQWSAGTEAYKTRMNEAEDPFLKFVNDLGHTVGEATSAVWDQVRGAFGRKDEPK